jgi:hypothetical protein
VYGFGGGMSSEQPYEPNKGSGTLERHRQGELALLVPAITLHKT